MLNFENESANYKFEGRFTAQIDQLESKKSKTGKDMLVVKFKVVGDNFKNYSVTEYFVWENAQSRSKFAHILDILELGVAEL